MARNNVNFLRSTESPMDFEYDQGHGPTSEDSPFPKGRANGASYKDNFAGQKRSSDHFDSPTKTSLPAMGKPDGQTILFSTTSSAKSPQFRQTSFTTPQRPIDTNFSSGPDRSSPINADSEDMSYPITRFTSPKCKPSVNPYSSKPVKKALCQSVFDKNASPSRKYDNSIVRKIGKRRRREFDSDVHLASRRSTDYSESDEVRPSSSDEPKRYAENRVQQMGFVPSVLTFIDAHPGLPNTLSVYVQFILNCFFAFCLMYVLYGVVSTIRHDIDERAVMESSEILAEMALCAHEYKENKCERDSRVPAMETVCNSWEKCMARDPYKVGRSRLSAGMFAEIFNSFIEPISIKALVVSVSVIVGCFVVNNLTFGLYRAKSQANSTPNEQTYMHHPSSHHIGLSSENEPFCTSYHSGMSRDVQYRRGLAMNMQSPTKRLGY